MNEALAAAVAVAPFAVVLWLARPSRTHRAEMAEIERKVRHIERMTAEVREVRPEVDPARDRHRAFPD